MTDKELFDALDPATWQQRPLQKVFTLSGISFIDGKLKTDDGDELDWNDLHLAVVNRFKFFVGKHWDKIDSLVVERFTDVDEKTMKPQMAVQIRFTLKNG